MAGSAKRSKGRAGRRGLVLGLVLAMVPATGCAQLAPLLSALGPLLSGLGGVASVFTASRSGAAAATAPAPTRTPSGGTTTLVGTGAVPGSATTPPVGTVPVRVERRVPRNDSPFRGTAPGG